MCESDIFVTMEKRNLQEVSAVITKERVYDALYNCHDPEIPVNIVDLGLIYDVLVEDDNIHVIMTLTAQGCPSSSEITEDVKARLEQIPGAKSAAVQIVWDPPWEPNRMSDAAKKQLGII